MKKVNEFLSSFVKMKMYQFAVRRETTGTGETIFTPMVKEPGLFKQWQQIVKIYNKYYVMHLDEQHELSLNDCHDHIVQFKKQLRWEVLQRKKSEVHYLKSSYGLDSTEA